MIFDFLKALVDDPSTDSIVSWASNGWSFVVWQPLEFTKDLLPRHLQITHFAKFHTYGFRKLVISSGQQLKFICNDFVRGKPELLDKIAQRYMTKMKDTELWKLDERLENDTSKEEYDLAMKDKEEMFVRKSKEGNVRMATGRKST
ncbi:Heat shock factor (HSF)-type DNA-binding [Arabidopsis thaliana x Arabidopsis arenosa]|uniref:Heat shock factor (HSF)-type DNA-binding n=1 Tax=Arabidopsis thaliana x Arabidopsis arenosa TaxID=1240361 RepID=A0A8T1Y5V1_9BRAS|nr:Heat shock factor (HSF)-type DNA-binding [Arabidopsis thaliana x Arabidopsis arenosa]